MGEVYRARDTRLGREVAIKVLPEAFASDSERLARFQREAQVLASLNHPHIAGIHGLEVGEGVRALVMELVEGPTLADRIAQGPLPLDEALPIARQIAEALEGTHEQGIVHRDLKPANIKVRPDGTVKVLDFGLAKLNDPNASNVSNDPNAASLSPTITSPAMMTGAGMILGTAAYMAPEQARGKAVDKRADIWAFGCVLYEMLTGRRAFEARTSRTPSRAFSNARATSRRCPRRHRRPFAGCWGAVSRRIVSGACRISASRVSRSTRRWPQQLGAESPGSQPPGHRRGRVCSGSRHSSRQRAWRSLAVYMSAPRWFLRRRCAFRW
jgi:serine/threonine protein kinase